MLLETLSVPQQQAVKLVKLSLDCFNNYGLMDGTNRYNVLEQRITLAATQKRDLHGFWAVLLNKMLWPQPTKAAGPEIVKHLQVGEQQQTLRALATEAKSLVMIARMLHDEDKETRKQLKAELSGLAEYDRKVAADLANFNDELGDM